MRACCPLTALLQRLCPLLLLANAISDTRLVAPFLSLPSPLPKYMNHSSARLQYPGCTPHPLTCPICTRLSSSDSSFDLLRLLSLEMDSRKSQTAYPDLAVRLTCSACVLGSNGHPSCSYHRLQDFPASSRLQGRRSAEARSLRGEYPPLSLGACNRLMSCLGSSVRVELGSGASPAAYDKPEQDAVGDSENGYEYVHMINSYLENHHVDFQRHPSDLLGVGGLFD